jgi:molybdate transport system substrate-binding protein
MKMNFWVWVGIATGFLALSVHASEITAAVAANFASPVREIISEFEKATGHKANLALGSSGTLFAQITQGAPFDVFLSADQTKPEELEKRNLSVTGSRFTYAIGALALWSSDPKVEDPKDQLLKPGNIQKLAIANPNHAPYGEAAVEVLKNLKVYEALAPKIIQGENIAKTYQFVVTGNAELGFVALSQVLKNGRMEAGRVWRIPDTLHKPIRQDAVLLNRGKQNPAAQAFLDYLKGELARRTMVSHGYRIERRPHDHDVE